MKPDEEVCLCQHVSLRKLRTYIRCEQPRVASQLGDCFGAGTACGWCRASLEQLHAQFLDGQELDLEHSPEEYAEKRREYREKKKRAKK
jgi:bacterioferritin-associated ferredoxin